MTVDKKDLVRVEALRKASRDLPTTTDDVTVELSNPVSSLLIKWREQAKANMTRTMADAVRADTELLDTRSEFTEASLRFRRTIEKMKDAKTIHKGDKKARKLELTKVTDELADLEHAIELKKLERSVEREEKELELEERRLDIERKRAALNAKKMQPDDVANVAEIGSSSDPHAQEHDDASKDFNHASGGMRLWAKLWPTIRSLEQEAIADLGGEDKLTDDDRAKIASMTETMKEEARQVIVDSGYTLPDDLKR